MNLFVYFLAPIFLHVALFQFIGSVKALMGQLYIFMFVWKVLFWYDLIFILKKVMSISSGWSWTHRSQPVWDSWMLGIQTESLMSGISVVFFHSCNLSQIHKVIKFARLSFGDEWQLQTKALLFTVRYNWTIPSSRIIDKT